MRNAEINRKTAETDIALKLELDGKGKSNIDTGVGFLDHMLTLFAKHGRFDLTLKCEGDTYVDDHHTVEDIGIALGDAFSQALGDKKGINRYGSAIIPMDESLILTAIDFSGRCYLGFDLDIPTAKVGTWWKSSGWPLPEARRAICTSANSPEPIPTTSSRARSSRRHGPPGRQPASIQLLQMKYRPRKEFYSDSDH